MLGKHFQKFLYTRQKTSDVLYGLYSISVKYLYLFCPGTFFLMNKRFPVNYSWQLCLAIWRIYRAWIVDLLRWEKWPATREYHIISTVFFRYACLPTKDKPSETTYLGLCQKSYLTTIFKVEQLFNLGIVIFRCLCCLILCNYSCFYLGTSLFRCSLIKD